MKGNITELLEEAIKLENNLAKLYGLYATNLKEDYDFWLGLQIEEKNHASLLATGKEFDKNDRFPQTILPGSIQELTDSNQAVENAIIEFEKNPDRTYAFEQALRLEKSAGEMHYQFFMGSDSNDKLALLFKKLNRMDVDHAERIYIYWQKNTK